MKPFANLDKTDRTLVGLSGLLAILLFALLLQDIWSDGGLNSDAIVIGQIQETHNKVKRKFNRSLLWYEAKQKDNVHENDWIFTGTDSVVKIRLETGDEIVVEPDSLIVLSRKNGVLELDLQHGRMLADIKTDTVKVNVVKEGKKQEVSLSTGVVRVAHKEVSEAVIQSEPIVAEVLPEVETIDQAFEKEVMQAPEGFNDVDDLGLLFRKNIQQSRSVYTGQKANLKIDWIDPAVRWTSYEMRISKNPDLSEPLAEVRSAMPESKVALAESGRYYYQVRGFDELGEISDWSKIHPAELEINFKDKRPGVNLSKKQLEYPIEREEFKNVTQGHFVQIPEEKPLKIQWETQEDAAKYRVLVSNKPDFSDLIEERITEESQVDLQNLKVGKNFVKIVSEDDKGVSISDEAVGEVITRMPPPDPSTLKTKRRNEEQLTLQWDKEIPSPGFEIVYKEGASKKLQRRIVKKHGLRLQSKTSEIEWKVRAVDPATKTPLSDFSETVNWKEVKKTIASVPVEENISTDGGQALSGVTIPQITSPEPRKTYIALKQEPVFMVIRWHYPEANKGYYVEISRKPDMSQPLVKKFVRNKNKLVLHQKFQSGVYYMRIRAKKDKLSSEVWSKVEPFRVFNR